MATIAFANPAAMAHETTDGVAVLSCLAMPCATTTATQARDAWW